MFVVALRHVSVKKNYLLIYLQQWYYRSTIKIHESSPVVAALVFIPSLCPALA